VGQTGHFIWDEASREAHPILTVPRCTKTELCL
jgi:hypothetical protein